MNKALFIDCETTGLDRNVHGLWQISFQLHVKGEEIERQTVEMQPCKGKLVSEEALQKNRMTVERLREMQPSHLAFDLFRRKLAAHVDKFDKRDKLWFVGYNAQFDAGFVRQWFEDHGDQYFGSWFWYPIIDVAVMAGLVLSHDRHLLENFKLGTVCRFLGLEFDEESAHDAQYDVEKTRQAFQALHARGLA
jgi:DNA polymerase III subunit epsilon